MHIHIIEHNEDVVDVIPFCSDACHRHWCDANPNYPYDGWSGCNEGGDVEEYCAHCGELCWEPITSVPPLTIKDLLATRREMERTS